MGSKVRIGSYIFECDNRNKDNHSYPVIGINRDKDFMPTVANMEGIDIRKYKIVEKGTLVYDAIKDYENNINNTIIYDL